MAHYQPRQMLVTGGAGFIGANFIHYMLAHDNSVQIINLDKLTYAGSLTHLKNLPSPHRHYFIEGDIADESLVNHVIQHHHIDTIVHFAAETHVDRSIEDPGDFIRTNLTGTYVLLEAARHHWLDLSADDCHLRRFHHISTDEVFGSLSADEPAFTEDSRYNPHSPYAASKAAADHLVRSYYTTYALPITLTNCSNNYGPYQHAEKFIPTIINACIHKQPIPIYGNGKNIRDWLYVEDHCAAILSVITQGKIGESYNIGGNNEWDNLALAKYIACKWINTIQVNNLMQHY